MMHPGVIGLDLSMTSSGVAVIARSYADESIAKWSFTIKSSPAPRPIRTANVRARRLADIVDRIETSVKANRPTIACVESPVPNRRMQSGMLLERGAIYWNTLAMLDRHDVEIVEVSPRERAQYATGNGAADKTSVAGSMFAEHDRVFDTDDECDAFVLALIGARLIGYPLDSNNAVRAKIIANLAEKRGDHE